MELCIMEWLMKIKNFHFKKKKKKKTVCKKKG